MAKKPTGVQVSRSGVAFVFTWKRAQNYSKQDCEYSINGGGWANLSVGKSATSATVGVNVWGQYPYGGVIWNVSFRVRGKYSGKWSGYSVAGFGIAPPYAPSVGASATAREVTNFSWGAEADGGIAQAFTVVEYQHQLTEESQQPNWNVGSVLSGANEGSINVTEDTSVIETGSHTRWFRVRSRGMAGDSGWVTTNRVYATPKPATIIEARATQDDSGVNGYISWQTQASAAYPIDSIDVEYVIVTPAQNVSLPSGELSWKNVGGLITTSGRDAVSFSTGSRLDDDKAIFVRVNTRHEAEEMGRIAYGVPQLMATGYLSDPEDLAIVDIDAETYRVTLQVSNESSIEDSIVAIRFKSDDEEFDIAVIPHGQNQVVVQCPQWGSGEISFGARAVVGSYEYTTRDDGVRLYNITERMVSKNTIWEGGTFPVAPANVTVTPTDVSGSIRVSWEWTWDVARSAEISWADHKDAWESTDEPSTYKVSNIHASNWNIAGLEVGKVWYVRVRLVGGTSDALTYSPWSPVETIDLSTAPAIPTLTLSKSVITLDDLLTAYWSYITTDGKAQAYAEICEAEINEGVITYGDVIAHTETAQHIDIDPKVVGWSAGETKLLCVRVVSGAGKSSQGWSAPVAVSIAEPLEVEISDTSLEHEVIVYNPQSFSGNPIEFESETLAPVVRDMSVDFSPKQDGTPWQSSLMQVPYIFQRTPQLGHDYNSEIVNAIIGGTVAWNQKIDKANFAGSGTINGVTFTNNGDGSWTISGTATALAGKDIISFDLSTGHKEMFYGGYNGGGWGKYCLYDYINDGLFTVYDVARISVATNPTRRIRFQVWPGQTINVKVTPMLFDLTQMFGSTIADYLYSLEQTTAGSGIAKLKEWGFDIDSYHAYETGSLESVNTSAHETTGKNLLKNTGTSKSENGITWTVNDDGSISASGTASGNSLFVVNTFDSRQGETVILNGCPTGGAANTKWQIQTLKSLTESSVATDTGSGTQINDLSGTYYIRCVVRNGNTVDFTFKPMIRLASVTDDAYEPYVKHSYPLDSDLTLRGIPKLDASNNLYYDGDVYEPSGAVTRNWGIVTFDGSEDETWRRYTSGSAGAYCMVVDVSNLQGTNSSGNLIADNLPVITGNDTWGNFDKFVAIGAGNNGLYTGVRTITTVEDWRAYLASNPLTVVYRLLAPTTETADPYTAIQTVDPYGTEEYIDYGVSQGTRDIAVPVGHQTRCGLIVPIEGYDELNVYVSPTADEADATVYAVDLDGTRYGGTLNVLTGVLTLTMAYIASYNEETIGEPWLSDCDVYESGATPSIGAEVVYTLAEPQTVQLTPTQVALLMGDNHVWTDGDDIDLDIADSVIETYTLKEMPLRVTVTGAGNGGTTSLVVSRATDYILDRPDESEFNGYKGETIAIASQTGEDEIVIDSGTFDDTAKYKLTASVKDSAGQTKTTELDFEVLWSHQAVVPDADVEVLDEGVVKITPQLPSETPEGWEFAQGDTCDIYRLSVDLPELIVSGAEFGTSYVDPYPAIGEFGGHRIVYRTKDGDYIAEDGQIAWLDLGEEDGDIFESEESIIDFDGEQILLKYSVDISNNWEKDFKETRYLGGSIEGDWNEGIRRTGSVSTATINLVDQETVRLLRRLANYTGICHIRTADGSSYPCDIQVSEDRQSDKFNAVSSFNLNIVRIDSEELDGVTYEEWIEAESE